MSNRLLLGLAVPFLFTTVAVAGPFFQLPAEITVMPGSVATVPVSATSPTSTAIEGMNLYVQVDAPIEIVDINFDGTIWPPTPMVTLVLPPDMPDGQHGYASVTSASVFIMPSVGLVANVLIEAPADAQVGTSYLFQLQWPDMGVYSMIGPDEPGIDPPLPTTLIRVVPEPATICLVLAAAGWVARRRR